MKKILLLLIFIFSNLAYADYQNNMPFNSNDIAVKQSLFGSIIQNITSVWIRKIFGGTRRGSNNSCDNSNNCNVGNINNPTNTNTQNIITNKQPRVWVAGKSLKECMGNQKIIDNSTIQCQRGYFKE